MSSPITSYAEVITRWDSLAEFADDIGVDNKHAYGMIMRDSIPPLYWPRVVRGASKRGYGAITYELLAKLAASERRPAVRVRRPLPQRRSRRVR